MEIQIAKGGSRTRMAAFVGAVLAAALSGYTASAADAPFGEKTPASDAHEAGTKQSGALVAQSSQLIEFDIAPGDLNSALLEFARQAGLQVFFQVEEIGDRPSPGTRGKQTAEQALQSLLENTNVTYRFSDPETVELLDAAKNATMRLDPIYVDANKRGQQDTQSVAGSVYAFDRFELEESRSRGLEDIARQTPNTFVDTRTNGDVVVFLRGNSTDNNNTDAGIGIYVDGAYNFIQGNNNNFPLFDVDEVNVLLGPQGALYGRNAVGGAINIRTADPSFETEAEASGEYSNFNGRRHEAHVNIPVGERFAFRAAALHNRRDSFYENTTIGQDEVSLLQKGIRLKGRARPIDEVDVVFGFERLEQDLPGTALTAVADLGSFETVTDVIGFNKRRSNRYNLTGTFMPVDWLNIKSITSFHQPRGSALVDGDSSAVVNSSVGVDFEATQFSQELLFSSPDNDGGRWDWTIGGTYFRDRIDTTQRNNVLAGVFANSFIRTEVEGDIDAYAVFGEATFAVTEKLKATGSLRYSKEEKNIAVVQDVFGPAANFLAPAATIDDGDTFKRLKPVASLSYDWTDNFMTYAKVATAYKSGGVNFGATPTPEDATFGPEDVVSYEVGVRSEWLDGRLQVNGTAFYQKQKNLQLRIRDTTAGINFFDNVGDGRTHGVELAARANPIEGLTMYANYGYLRPRFKDTTIQAGAMNVDVSGNRIPDIPEHTFSFGARYDSDLTDWASAYIRADHYMTRGGAADAQNLFNLDRKDNTNLAAGIEGDHFGIQLFVTNLFDRSHFEFSPTAAGLGQRNAPRTFGVSATARW